MKLKNNWKKLNKVILRVDNVKLRYEKRLSIILNCGFENISKGRCILSVNTKDKKKKDALFVFTDKALMSVEVFYSNEEISQIIKLLNFNKSSKKTLVTLMITDELMINENNYLFVKDNVEVEISAVEWNIPLS
tara:strand:- start:718 stop:1119 length:402 start_codon:yes stop_codon:yes gene_type:complete